MKFLACIILFFSVELSFAQTTEAKSPKDEVFTVVEYMPEFPGGIAELMKFIKTNIVYPKKYDVLNLGGKAFLKFKVTDEGKIENVHMLKGTGFKEMDDEALRVISLMPDWTPGMQNGRKVNVFFNVPINFALNRPYYIYNVSNKSENYIKTKELLEAGKKEAEIIDLLESDPNKKTDLDVMYNLGVAYYISGNNKKACKYFKAILEKSDEKITVVNNAKEYLQKYCSN